MTAFPAMSIAQAHAMLTASGQMFEMEDVRVASGTIRAWKNGPKRLVDLWAAAAAHADKTFIVYRDDRVTYDAFRRASRAFAQALVAAGIEKGDRVAIAMRNQTEWPVVFYAAALAGAVATPLNAWWTANELAFALRDCGAKALVMDDERCARLRDLLPDIGALRARWVCGVADADAPHGVTTLESVIGAPATWDRLPEPGAPPVTVTPEDPATIFYTSGTSGKPKGALASHRAVTTPVLAQILSQARAFLRRGETPPALDPAAPQKCGLLAIPLFHVTGCFSAMNAQMAMGNKLVMLGKWDTERALQLIERERAANIGGVPTVAWQLIEHPAREKYDLSSIESVTYGGAPAASELVRRIRQTFPNAAPGTGWGMTETCATFTHHVGEDYEHRPESCGPAVPVADMKIVDPAGATLPAGEVGELLVRGPHVVEGYWNRPEENAETFVDGWMKTGDLARIDDEGFCFIVDRAKDVIIRGGENIYSAEVEGVLYEHPAIMDAALVPIPHPRLGEEAGAIVTLKPNQSASEDELKAHVAKHLAPFKIPARVITRNEPLPRNANGKIMKRELRALFVSEQA